MRYCATCKYASRAKGTRTIKLPGNITVTQTGSDNYVCQRPGGVKGLCINYDTDTFDCESYAPMECSYD